MNLVSSARSRLKDIVIMKADQRNIIYRENIRLQVAQIDKLSLYLLLRGASSGFNS